MQPIDAKVNDTVYLPGWGGGGGERGERPRHEENMAGDCREVCVLQGPRVKNYTLFAYFTVQWV